MLTMVRSVITYRAFDCFCQVLFFASHSSWIASKRQNKPPPIFMFQHFRFFSNFYFRCLDKNLFCFVCLSICLFVFLWLGCAQRTMWPSVNLQVTSDSLRRIGNTFVTLKICCGKTLFNSLFKILSYYDSDFYFKNKEWAYFIVM